MPKQTQAYVFGNYFKYKQLCRKSQVLFQTLAITFSKGRLVSINEINTGIPFLVLVIVQYRCQDRFILRARKISTMLGAEDMKFFSRKKRKSSQEVKSE